MAKKLKISIICFLTFLLITSITLFGVKTLSVKAVNDHSSCDGSSYCLVCDVANKIKSLPSKEDINVDNAVDVIQTINDIDRIKFDLTDEQFYEVAEIVGYHEDVYERVVLTKYVDAIDKVKELTGIKLAISKSFDLGEESVLDTSQTEVAFEITNLSNNSISVLKLYDMPSYISSFGAEFYSMTSDGWNFQYLLPSGNYSIKEINLDSAIKINGGEDYFHCSKIQYNGITETGENAKDGMVISLTEDSTISFYNIKCSNMNAVVDSANGTISGICDACGSDFIYDLVAPGDNLVSDGVSTFDNATLNKFANNTYHFQTAENDYGAPYVEYEYKNTLSGSYAPTSDYTQAGYYKATLNLQISYVQTLQVSIEYKVSTKIAYLTAGLSASCSDAEKIYINGQLPSGYTLQSNGDISNGVNVVSPIDVTDPTVELSSKAYMYRVENEVYIVNGAEVSFPIGIFDGENLFKGMQNLTEVELKNFNLSNAITLSGMFEDCSALTRIDFSNCNFSSTNDQTYFEGMFSGCSSLSTIKLPTTSNALIELPRVFNDNLGATYSVMPSASATVDEIYATIVSEGGVGGSESQPDQAPEINDSAQVEPQEEDKLKSIIEIAMAITFVSLPVGFGVMLLVMCIKGKKPE